MTDQSREHEAMPVADMPVSLCGVCMEKVRRGPDGQWEHFGEDVPYEPEEIEAPRRSAPHALMAHFDNGYWSVTVTCPDSALGAERPCAVWEDGDGSKRLDACTFQQYVSDCSPEEWLHGRHDFGPVPIVEGGSGEEWHAKFAAVANVLSRTESAARSVSDGPDGSA